MNQKGFTLVEVIVTIAIIGIISGIAYGAITNMQSKNLKKRYQSYENILTTGAELYVDQYSRDLWSGTETTPYCISYRTLLGEGLIQAYQQKNEKIDEDHSFVYVTRENGNSNYKAYLTIQNNRYQTEGIDRVSCTGANTK